MILFKNGSLALVYRLCCTKMNVNHSLRPVESVLIANRGEIACRIIRTAKRMGIRSVSVFSEPDARSLHVVSADEAYLLGAAQSTQSYLNQEKILQIAESSAVHAIHPGYGFLSENADFASLCSERGVIFIGPSASAIRNMGIKSKAKEIMSAAGVPIIAGYHGSDQDDSLLAAKAESIGFPVLIKAIKGGGGKGMRICHSAGLFQEQLESARRESLKAFGDDAVLIEKFITKPRHIEVQVFGDHQGNYVYLFERDCSVQRRHQKIIEEAPAPGIDSETRRRLGEAAVRAAKAVDYVGAGTVEFLFDRNDGQFYFMEMNTRLQVEHPITEYITDTDLVEWQFRVASGEALPLSQDQLKEPKGHAFEARIYAEDTENGFIPAPGPLTQLIYPSVASNPTIRVESGVRGGDEVSIHYDPMIAKIVAWGENRQKSLAKLTRALIGTKITGLKTNIDFLLRVSSNSDFQNADVYTDFIEDHKEKLIASPTPNDHIVKVAAFGLFSQLFEKDKSVQPYPLEFQNFRLIKQLVPLETTKLVCKDKTHTVQYRRRNDGQLYDISIDGRNQNDIDGKLNVQNGELAILTNGKREVFDFFNSDGVITLFTRNPTANSFVFEVEDPEFLLNDSKGKGNFSDGQIVSPMPGVIEHVFVKPGDRVKAGDQLLILIAMKMEYNLKSPIDGSVVSINCSVGQNVPKGLTLVKIE